MNSRPSSSRWIMLSTFNLSASVAISQRSAHNQSTAHTDHSHLGTLISTFQSYANKYLWRNHVIVDHVYVYMLHACMHGCSALAIVMATVRLGSMLRWTSRMLGRQGARLWGEEDGRRVSFYTVLNGWCWFVLQLCHSQPVAPLLLEVPSVG